MAATCRLLQCFSYTRWARKVAMEWQVLPQCIKSAPGALVRWHQSNYRRFYECIVSVDINLDCYRHVFSLMAYVRHRRKIASIKEAFIVRAISKSTKTKQYKHCHVKNSLCKLAMLKKNCAIYISKLLAWITFCHLRVLYNNYLKYKLRCTSSNWKASKSLPTQLFITSLRKSQEQVTLRHVKLSNRRFGYVVKHM